MKIQLTDPIRTFGLHFSNRANKRILFSGKFGLGKTFFLKEFLESTPDVNSFWISPVRYSVGQNEDIFEYIKFDLALQLIARQEFAPSLKINFDEDQYLYQYISSQPQVAVNALISAIESLANDDSIEQSVIKNIVGVREIAIAFIESLTKYKKFKQKIDEAASGTSGVLQKYLKESVTKKGSIFEDDIITQTIRAALEICKENNYNDEHKHYDNILIVDDFDRLDPEHVFRILNILSAHNDVFEVDNKFGFDKIVIVCDYHNIASIYAHKYGSVTDFKGYISKFYSTEVFFYNNTDAVQLFCRDGLSGIVRDRDSLSILGLILAYFVEKNILTIRDITKIKVPHKFTPVTFKINMKEIVPKAYQNKHSYSFSERFIDPNLESVFITTDDYSFLQAIRVLIAVFGSFNSLKNAVEKLKIPDEDTYDTKYAIPMVRALVPIINHAAHYREPGYLVCYFQPGAHGHVELQYPVYNFFNALVLIDTGWSESNPYLGDVSYYKNLEWRMKEMSLKNLYNFSPDLRYKVLFGNLFSILIFLEESGTLQKMDITRANNSID